MDKENLLFELLKDEYFNNKKEIEEKLIYKYKYSEDDAKKMSTRIINYQVEKYGISLYRKNVKLDLKKSITLTTRIRKRITRREIDDVNKNIKRIENGDNNGRKKH